MKQDKKSPSIDVAPEIQEFAVAMNDYQKVDPERVDYSAPPMYFVNRITGMGVDLARLVENLHDIQREVVSGNAPVTELDDAMEVIGDRCVGLALMTLSVKEACKCNKARVLGSEDRV
jgi:hypothetical protein